MMSSSSWLESIARNWGKGWEEQKAVWRWREAVGERLSKLARPLYVERGILYIAVASPVVANELRLWAQEIISRLAQIAPKSNVKELQFKILPEEKEVEEFSLQPGAEELNRAEEMIPEDLLPSLRSRFLELLANVLAKEKAILAKGGRRCRRCGVAFLGEGEECALCRLLP